MSVRIYTLAHALGMTNSALIELLKRRHIISPYVRTACSTVDNVSATALRLEFAKSVKGTGRSAKAALALLDRLARIEVVDPPRRATGPYGRVYVSSSWHGARKARRTRFPEQPHFGEP